MASDDVVVKVTPDGSTWHVDVADRRILTLRSKEAAVAEAFVQAMPAQSGRVIIYAADGSIEHQTVFPDGAEAERAAAVQDAD